MIKINFNENRNIALDKIGLDCAIIEDSIIEKPYGLSDTKANLKGKLAVVEIDAGEKTTAK